MTVTKQSNVDKLAELFGGKGKLAVAIGRDPALPSRWNSKRRWGSAGHVPSYLNAEIMLAARIVPLPEEYGKHRKKFIDAVAALLDPHTCPTCGQAMPDGRQPEWRRKAS